jgi:geranylgeranyl reductase family protein
MSVWDVAVVGAGPAGAATALGALAANPCLRVALVDRSSFPRDKACGDGIAPHVIDLLDELGVSGIVAGHVPVSRLRLTRGAQTVDRSMARSTWVIPRAEFDLRLVEAAQRAGAVLIEDRVRAVRPGPTSWLDGRHEAHIVVGADGAQSAVRRSLGMPAGPMAVALRGYAPTPRARAGRQVIAFDDARQPAYAWSFDRGDGLSNVGYGVLPGRGSGAVDKAHLMARLDALLPGSTARGTGWKGHRLPLSTGRWRPGAGSVVLAGDAAGLVNPMTGEGIYYAVATGLAAGRAAAAARAAGDSTTTGSRYAAAVRPMLDAHLRHVWLAGHLCRHGRVIDAGLRASAADQRVFDELVELGLARGRITTGVAVGLARELVRAPARRTAGMAAEEPRA